MLQIIHHAEKKKQQNEELSIKGGFIPRHRRHMGSMVLKEPESRGMRDDGLE